MDVCVGLDVDEDADEGVGVSVSLGGDVGEAELQKGCILVFWILWQKSAYT